MIITDFINKMSQQYPDYQNFFDDYGHGISLKPPKKVSFSGTDFQQKVLRAVCTIPYGQTASYSDIARAIGKPRAVRAVASAVARNKLLIVIPCHRVIRSNGTIGKYRSGAKIKFVLLQFEKRNVAAHTHPAQPKA